MKYGTTWNLVNLHCLRSNELQIVILLASSSCAFRICSISSIKPEPTSPAGTAKTAIPSTPIIHEITRPPIVKGGFSAKPEGSPIYCRNAHIIDSMPFLYCSGYALCSIKNRINDSIKVTTDRKPKDRRSSRFLLPIPEESSLKAFMNLKRRSNRNTLKDFKIIGEKMTHQKI